jgi:hypothetical protein
VILRLADSGKGDPYQPDRQVSASAWNSPWHTGSAAHKNSTSGVLNVKVSWLQLSN